MAECNHCSLRQITRRAEARGATVTTRQQTLVEVGLGGDGWIEVRVSDEPEPVAWFTVLTTHFVC